MLGGEKIKTKALLRGEKQSDNIKDNASVSCLKMFPLFESELCDQSCDGDFGFLD